jgi:hypothetical protein
MLAVPVIVFALAVKLADSDWSGVTMVIVYIVGTAPGLVLAASFPGGIAQRLGWSFGYLLGCAVLLFVVTLTVGCLLTDVCL